MTEAEITALLLAGEIVLCPRCKGLGAKYVYRPKPKIPITNGCALCETLGAPRGYVLKRYSRLLSLTD